MTRPFVPRDLVARELSVSTHALVKYERLGLIRASREDQVEGYEPSEVRRIWTIVSFQRDLGINLAGVEVILRLCDRMSRLHDRLGGLAGELSEILDRGEVIEDAEPAEPPAIPMPGPRRDRHG
ncbi:chaperone modulator CbpM [Aquisphaera insulae]|uniref:chaperone modulator CbpM n=1 Tax=Aquisphaera insulae TaxID=2712864 RepID=UPI0013ED66CB|nr:chaperone modulator CbpM [Aquisphaera insulae]